MYIDYGDFMKKDTFANRLKQAMNIRNLKQIDIVNKTKIDKTLLNKYLKGISEPKQDNLSTLAEALDVNEVWLMGYDVDYEKTKTVTIFDKDFLILDKDFLGFKKGSEIPFDYLILYIEAIYGTLSLSKENFMLVETLIDALKQENDDESLKVISKFITEAINNLDDIENLQRAIKTSRKESIYVLYRISDFIRKRDNNELKNDIDEQDMKKIEDYINMEMKNPNINGKKVKFKFNDEICYLMNKMNNAIAKDENKEGDENKND